MKFIKKTLFAITVILILLFAAAWIYLENQSPIYSGDIQLNSLENKVEILFDEFGIPHIYAENENDAYYALGYVQAQERLFQMVLYRRLVQGRAAEIFGADLVKTDKFFHTLGLNKLSKRAAKKHFFSAEKFDYQEPALAYLKGINDFIAEDRLPIEFALIGFKPDDFKVEDIYGSLNLTALGFSFAQRDDLILNYIYNDLGPEYFKDWSAELEAVPDTTSVATALLMGEKLDEAMTAIGLPLWEGSNGWVLSPQKTKSGKALLANDTHIGFSQPAVWYEAHINYPGYDFYGSFLASVPYAVIGHNNKLAWGLTIFPFDNMDYYQIEDTEDPSEYVFFGDTLSYETEEICIKVKDAKDELFDLKTTKFGPVINHIEPFIDSIYNSNIALSWSIFHLEQTAIEALYKLNQAQDLQDFQDALPLIDVVGLNVMYADAEDNIAWWACGKIPLRDSLSQAFTFLNSNHSKDKIIGFQDFSNNPFLINPPSGYIVTANNNPVLSGSHYERGNYLPADRFYRITNLLEEKDDWDMENCKDIQLDHVSTVKEDISKYIVKLLIDIPEEGLYKKAAQLLSEWDGSYGLQEVAPTIFSRMYYHIAYLATADELGPVLFKKSLASYLLMKTLPVMIKNEASPWWNRVASSKETTRDMIITEAFMTAVDELSRDLGPEINDWQWQRVHQLTHDHPIGKKKPLNRLFNVGPFSIAGGNQVPNKMAYHLSNKNSHKIISGPAIRMLIDFGDVDAAQNIIPTGQSGNFFSPHYDDQAEMFVKGEWRDMKIQRADVETDKHQTLMLLPK